MLASGAHVEIDGQEYLLDESMDNHYVHRLQTIVPQRAEIAGDPEKQNVDPKRLLWAMEDWSGGEGNRIFYPDDPLVYDKSNGLNPRIRGQLTGRPTREYTTVTANDRRLRPFLAVADQAVWIGGGYRLAYSTDGTTWTAKTNAEVGLYSLSTDYRITALAGDNELLYYSAWHSGSSGTRITRAIASSGSGTDVLAEATGSVPYTGMALMGGRLYAWTGRKLFELDIFESLPLASDQHRKVYDTGVDPAASSGLDSLWWAGCVSAENAVFMFYSTDAQSRVYMFKGGVGRPVWEAPQGFSIKGMAYQNGILFMAGHWGGKTTAVGRGALYAMPLDSWRPIFIGWFRKHDNLKLQMQEMATSYGAQILVAGGSTGRLFVYDAEMDAISMLDDLDTDRNPPTDALVFTSEDHRVGDMITFGDRRIVAIYQPGSSGPGAAYQVVAYNDDEPVERQAGTATNPYSESLWSGSWDFGIPYETKALMGFHVTWKVEDPSTESGLIAGQEIQVQYQIDGAGGYTSAGTISSTTTPSGDVRGRHFIAIAGVTTEKFYALQIKVTLSGTNGVQPPILYGLTTEAQLSAQTETWELVVRTKDELNRTRPSHRRWSASVLRDKLETLAKSQEAVEFKDGYRYVTPGAFTTHTVTIEDPVDVIDRNAEGATRIVLRAVSI